MIRMQRIDTGSSTSYEKKKAKDEISRVLLCHRYDVAILLYHLTE